MDAESFLDETNRPPMPRFREWFWAIFKTALGAFLLWIVAATLPAALLLLRGWVGMLGLILLLHFGTFQMLSLFWQSFGVQAQPIMMAPLRSQSLSEFWGKRWNLGFRQLAHELIFLPSGKYLPVGVAGLLVFFVSGLLHDAVISVPAQAGYGLPTGYFLLQGLGVIAERSSFGKQLGLGRGTRGWLFMALVAAGPVFWLFHSAFVTRVFIPFMEAIHAV
ncbi:MAG: MBOAT family protein [Candidatus Acidiferrum sp.]